jgi:hypothetical protein
MHRVMRGSSWKLCQPVPRGLGSRLRSLCALLVLLAGCDRAESSPHPIGAVPPASAAVAATAQSPPELNHPQLNRDPPREPVNVPPNTTPPVATMQTVAAAPMIGPWKDYGHGVAVDGQGNVVIAGATMGVLEGATTHGAADGFVSKFAADGTWLWTQQYGTSGSDMIAAVAIAPDGDVVIAGAASGQYEQDEASDARGVFVARLDPDGQMRWVKQFGASGVTLVSAIAVSADERIYVAGEGPDDPSKDQFVATLSCFAADGSSLWHDQWGGSPGAEPFGIATRGDAVYVVGRSMVRYDARFWGDSESGAWAGVGFVRRYDTSGQLLWERTVDAKGSEVHAVAIEEQLGAVVSGRTFGAVSDSSNRGAFDAFLMRFGADGSPGTSMQFGTLGWDSSTGVALLPGGDMLVAGDAVGDFDGDPATGYGGYLMRCDAAGKPRWIRQGFADTVLALTAGADERAYLTGWLFSAAPPDADAYEVDAYLTGFAGDGTRSLHQVLGSAPPPITE